MSGRTAIVTGASGFIGGWLLRCLHERGWNTWTVGRSSDADARWDELWQGGLDGSSASAVFHLAAFVPPKMEDSSHAKQCLEDNALLTLRLAEWTAKYSTARLVFASTGQIYGFNKDPVAEESRPQPAPRACFYLASKLLGETFVERAVLHHGLRAVSVRIGCCYGPGMKDHSLVARFAYFASRNEPLPLTHQGAEQFDFVHVGDVVECLVRAAERNVDGVLHAGSGQAVTAREVAESVNETMGNNAGCITVEPHSVPAQPGFAPLDMTRSRALLGVEPRGIRQGIREYCEWLTPGR